MVVGKQHRGLAAVERLTDCGVASGEQLLVCRLLCVLLISNFADHPRDEGPRGGTFSHCRGTPAEKVEGGSLELNFERASPFDLANNFGVF
jgi:hypothetical protein